MDCSSDDLVGLWGSADPDPSRALTRPELTDWVGVAETKSLMRLAWDLGIATDPTAAFSVAINEASASRMIELAARDSRKLSAALRHDVLATTARHPAPFSCVRISAGPLVHLTHEPAKILRSGFVGIDDPALLATTFGAPKATRGFNFAFDPWSFDLENFATDGFYGSDAIVFVARHLLVLNTASGDLEAIFLGADAEIGDMVHVAEDNGVWYVLSAVGKPVFGATTLGACVDWIDRKIDLSALRISDGRVYEMRALDGEDWLASP